MNTQIKAMLDESSELQSDTFVYILIKKLSSATKLSIAKKVIALLLEEISQDNHETIIDAIIEKIQSGKFGNSNFELLELLNKQIKSTESTKIKISQEYYLKILKEAYEMVKTIIGTGDNTDFLFRDEIAKFFAICVPHIKKVDLAQIVDSLISNINEYSTYPQYASAYILAYGIGINTLSSPEFKTMINNIFNAVMDPQSEKYSLLGLLRLRKAGEADNISLSDDKFEFLFSNLPEDDSSSSWTHHGPYPPFHLFATINFLGSEFIYTSVLNTKQKIRVYDKFNTVNNNNSFGLHVNAAKLIYLIFTETNKYFVRPTQKKVLK